MAATPMSHTRITRVRLVVLTLVLGVTMIPAAQAKGTVDFCIKHPHRDAYHLIKIGGRAADALTVWPGGAPVGDPIPTDEAHVFGPDCEPLTGGDPKSTPPTTTTTTTTTTSSPTTTTTTTDPSPTTTTTTTTMPGTTTTTTAPPPPPTPEIIARAWSTDGSGDQVLIAQLTDMDFSGTPTAGDIVGTAYFPLRTDGSSFGAFGTTYHTIEGGYSGSAADGSTMLAAWTSCGDRECHFEWSVYDDGTTRYERYSEYMVLSGGGITGRTGFYDTTVGTEQDVVSVNPASPSDPGVLTYDGAVSPTDDPFLDVSLG